MKNCAPVCILPHGFGSCLGSLKHYLSGVACRAVSGIDVSVKPVCLRLWSCPDSSNSVGGLRSLTSLDVVTVAFSVTLLTIVAFRPLFILLFQSVNELLGPFKPAACRCVLICSLRFCRKVLLRLLRHDCIVSTVPVASAAVVFFVFTSPFSLPS